MVFHHSLSSLLHEEGTLGCIIHKCIFYVYDTKLPKTCWSCGLSASGSHNALQWGAIISSNGCPALADHPLQRTRMITMIAHGHKERMKELY